MKNFVKKILFWQCQILAAIWILLKRPPSRGLAQTAHRKKIPWIIDVFLQNSHARERTSDLPGRVPSAPTTRLPHLGTETDQNLLILSFIMKTPEIWWNMIRFIANALLSPIHIIKILLQPIRGAVTPNIGSCGALWKTKQFKKKFLWHFTSRTIESSSSYIFSKVQFAELFYNALCTG